MDLQQLLASAREEAERAALLWYASEQSDNAAPRGACHVVVTDAELGAKLVAAGQGHAVAGGVQLHRRWEHTSDDLPMAQHWSAGFATALRRAGHDCKTVDAPSGVLDTSSLRRGLRQLADLGVLSARTAGGPPADVVFVSRAGRNAPFVLELRGELARAAATSAYLASVTDAGLPVKRSEDGVRVRVADDVDGALNAVVHALRHLFEREPATVAAYAASGEALPW